MLNVYDSEKNEVVKIEKKDFDPKIHSHRNTHEKFSKEFIESLKK